MVHLPFLKVLAKLQIGDEIDLKEGMINVGIFLNPRDCEQNLCSQNS